MSGHNIDDLFGYSDQYIIPQSQKGVKKLALILYNSYERPRAGEEASLMHENLQKADFLTTVLHWSNTLEVSSMIYENLPEDRKQISLLFLSIMTHGTVGTLYGEGSSKLLITDLLTQLTNILPENVPLVCTYYLISLKKTNNGRKNLILVVVNLAVQM